MEDTANTASMSLKRSKKRKFSHEELEALTREVS